MIRNIAVGLMFAGLMFLAGQSLMAKSGLECPPQPFPITVPPELMDTPGMREFAEHIDRQFEEIYLRFCFHIDSLKDSLVVGDSLVYDSVHIGDSTVLDSVGNIELEDGCTEYADIIRPCDDDIVFDANTFVFIDDTGGSGGDQIGGTIDFSFRNTSHTRAVTWSWPATATKFSTRQIIFPDTIATWSSARWRFSGSGSQKRIFWEKDDDVYTQFGQVKLIGNSASPGTTTVTLPQAYSNDAYRVQLTPVDIAGREKWSATWSMGDKVRLFNTTIFAQFATNAFKILHPIDDTVYIEWVTHGNITGVSFYR